MATEVLMPQMGESIAEGTITKWLAQVGDTVERDQPLFEISTDKVDAEIPSPASGVLAEIRHQEGETVSVNEVVALIGAAGEQPAAEAKGNAAKGGAAAPVQKEKAATEEGGRPATKSRREEPKERPAGREQAPAEAEAEAEGGKRDEEDTSAPADDEAERIRRFSSPVVRKIAAEEGVDVSQVEGTGIHGRVTKRDIQGYLEHREKEPAPATSPAPAARPGPPGFHVPAYREGENVEIEPMSKIRQITAAHMTYSKTTSAHVTTVFHMDMSRISRARRKAKDGFERAHGTKLTFMPFIFKAVVSALKANPKLNSAIDGTNIVYKKDINLGMAVAMDRGLIVPVIRHADQLSLAGLAKAANDLADRARGKKLKPEEVEGGTFTITNPGVFGSLFGTPIINQPQVGILGIGAIEKRPVVETDADENDVIAIKTMAYLSITYDHRLVDGADADRFMNDLQKTLTEESWSELDPFY